MPSTLLLPPLEFSDLPTALKIGECPSCLEGEVKPLRAESKLTAPVTKVQAKTSHFEVVFFIFEKQGLHVLIALIKSLSWEPVAPNLAHISFGRKNPKCQMEGLQSWTNWNTSKVLLWHLQIIQIMKKQQICNTLDSMNTLHGCYLIFV